MAPENGHEPRLCHLKKWTDFQGYGFNLHAEKSRKGQFVGKVDPNSPAERVGLKEHDRIVEVNGVNISNENHQQVVNRIKKDNNQTSLLVVDKVAEEYYKLKDIIIHSNHEDVEVHICPDTSQEQATVYKITDGKPGEEQASQQVTEVELNHKPENDDKIEVNNRPDVIESSTPSEVQVTENSIPPAEEPKVDEQEVEPEKPLENESNNNETEQAEKVVEAAVVAAATIVENDSQNLDDKKDDVKREEQEVVDALENLALEQQKSSRSSTVSSTGSVDVNGHKEYDLSTAVKSPEENETIHVTAIKSEHPAPYTDNVQEVQRASDETMLNARQSVVVGGVEFAGSVKEAREKMKKKTDLRSTQQNMREKYDLLNRL